MKKSMFSCIVILIVFTSIGIANAVLIDNSYTDADGNDWGLIFDDQTNLTWLKNADNGTDTISPAEGWASTLVYAGSHEWFLPGADESCGTGTCTTSDMGALLDTYGIDMLNTYFVNLATESWESYWTRDSPSFNRTYNYTFSFHSGFQSYSSGAGPAGPRYQWALHFGELKAPETVPEPSTLLLFGTGLVGIGIFRRKFKG